MTGQFMPLWMHIRAGVLSESDGGAAKAVSGAPIKAIKMSLSGQFAANCDIWYRVCDSGV